MASLAMTRTVAVLVAMHVYQPWNPKCYSRTDLADEDSATPIFSTIFIHLHMAESQGAESFLKGLR